MEIQVLLNPSLPSHGELQAELSGELNALQRSGITITAKTAPPPEGTLGFGEVYQFIIDNREEIASFIPLLTAVVQVIADVLRRRGITPPKPVRKPTKSPKTKSKKRKTKTKKAEPIAIILVGEHQLNLPCTARQAGNFVKKLRKQGSGKVKKSEPETHPNEGKEK